jgi:hypothetical protein
MIVKPWKTRFSNIRGRLASRARVACWKTKALETPHGINNMRQRGAGAFACQ